MPLFCFRQILDLKVYLSNFLSTELLFLDMTSQTLDLQCEKQHQEAAVSLAIEKLRNQATDSNRETAN